MIQTEFTTIASAPVFTSAIHIQGKTRTTITFVTGSLSAGSQIMAGGSFTGSVTLQRSWNNGVNYHDVSSWATDQEDTADKPEPATVLYRLGCKTGDFTTGEAVVKLVGG